MGKLKDLQKDYIVAQAAKLFLAKDIESITMSNIAKECEVGEATLYRYFGKKQNLVIMVGTYLWQKASSFLNRESFYLTGAQAINAFYKAFYDVFVTDPSFYRFIFYFDSFLLNNKIEDQNMLGYEEQLSSFKNEFNKAYERGVNDGSLRIIENSDIFYFTSTHSILNLCKKLSSQGILLHQDTEIKKEKEIEMLIDMIMSYIKA